MTPESTKIQEGTYKLELSFEDSVFVEIKLRATKEDTISSLGTALQRAAYNALVSLFESQKTT